MSTTVTLNETQATYTVPFDESIPIEGPVFLERKGRRVAVIIQPEEFEAFRRWQDSRSWQQRSLDHLQGERAAFRRLLPELLKTHRGQFVAIRDGCFVDADADEAHWHAGCWPKVTSRSISRKSGLNLMFELTDP